MACGCNKKNTNNRTNIINKGKKVASKKQLPLVTVRKQTDKKTKGK